MSELNYSPITRLNEEDRQAHSAELDSLTTVWKERRAALEAGGALDGFLRRMQREWAIETGIIERLYAWDRGVTEMLIEQGIEASIISHGGGYNRGEADHVKRLIDDQLGIVEGLFEFVKGDRPLTEHYIRTLHQEFTRNQDTTEAIDSQGHRVEVALLKGEYKKHPNNPRRPDGVMHPYCPPEIVADEMQHLVAWYQDDSMSFPAEVVAAWLHHRFTQIHPFQDGNGRVARALATLVLLRGGLFPVVVRDADRREYIGALESADAGALAPLVALFARREKEAILGALGLEQETRREAAASQILKSAVQALKGRKEQKEAALQRVFMTAAELQKQAHARFGELAAEVSTLIKDLAPKGEQYSSRAGESSRGADNAHWYYGQIVDTAKGLDYYANLDVHRAWARLGIKTREVFDLVVSFHGIGHQFQGVLVASAFCFRRITTEDGGTEVVGLSTACQNPFQFNYAETLPSTQARFAEWLETSIAIALEEWRRSVSA